MKRWLPYLILFVSFASSAKPLLNAASAKPNINSEFFFVLKPKDYKPLIPGPQNQTDIRVLEDLKFNQPFQTWVQGIQVTSKIQSNLRFRQNESSPFQYSVRFQELRIDIDRILTKDKITTKRGNINLVTEVEGVCRNIVLIHRQQFTAEGPLELSTEGALTATTRLGELNYINDWDIEMENCQGFPEYAKEIESALLEALNDSSLFVGELEETIQNQAQSFASDLETSILQAQTVRIPQAGKVIFQPQEIGFDPASLSFLISGAVSVEFLGVENSEVIPFEASLQKLFEAQRSGMILSKNFIQKCSDLFFSKGIYTAGFESQKIKSMRNFQRSRFLQFFVFPEIKKFSKRANFIMNAYLTTAPVFQYQRSQGNKVRIATSGLAQMDSFAPKQGGYLPFLNFPMGYALKGHMKVKNQQLKIGFEKPRLNLGHQWAPSYVRDHKPNTWFRKDLIKDEVVDLMRKTEFAFDLPSFELPDFQKLVPVALEESEDLIQMIYQLDSASNLP